MSKNEDVTIKPLALGSCYKVNIEGIEYLVRLVEDLNLWRAWCRCLNLSDGSLVNLTLYYSQLDKPISEAEKSKLVDYWTKRAQARIEQYARIFGDKK